MSVEEVRSADGTPIACWVSGEGPPLVLVHGTSGDHASFRFLAPLLEPHFTLWVLDRRGHGRSGDADGYALEREFEDIAAVVDHVGEPAGLFGHSFGADCALNGALLATRLSKLILYEPPLGLEPIPEDWLVHMDDMMAAGEREHLMEEFMLAVVGMTPGELDEYREGGTWDDRVARAHLLPREFRAQAAYAFEPSRFAHLSTPTLLLLGAESPAWASNATHLLRSALPDVRLELLPGEGHSATSTAPDVVAAYIHNFLR